VENYAGSLGRPLNPDYCGSLLGLGGVLSHCTAVRDSLFPQGDRPSPLGLLPLLFLPDEDGARPAREAMAKLLAREPNALLCYWMGVAYQVAGDYAQARRLYAQRTVWNAYRTRAWPYNLSVARLREMNR